MIRPSRRRVIFVLLSVGLLLLTLVAVFLVRSLTARPGLPLNQGERLRSLVLEYQPEGDFENGWALALEAKAHLSEIELLMLAEVPAPAGEIVEPEVAYGDLVRPEQTAELPAEIADRVMERTRRAIAMFEEGGGVDLLRRAAASPRAVREFGDMPDDALPDGYLNRLSKLSLGRMGIAHADGRFGDAAIAAEQALAMARITLQQPVQIDQIIGSAMVLNVANEVGVLARWLPERELASLLEAVNRQRRLIPPPIIGVRGERIFQENYIQMIHSDDGRGGGRLLPRAAEELGSPVEWPDVPGGEWISETLASAGMSNLLSPMYAGKKAVMRKHSAYFDAVEEIAALQPWEREKHTDPGDLIEDLGARYTALSGAHIGGNFWPRDGAEAALDGLELLLAIELHRARSGVLPQGLEDLVPALIPGVPLDPHSGRAYVYRIDPSSPGGYVLYGVGADGEDNGGMPDPKGYSPVAPGHSRGFDFVFGR